MDAHAADPDTNPATTGQPKCPVGAPKVKPTVIAMEPEEEEDSGDDGAGAPAAMATVPEEIPAPAAAAPPLATGALPRPAATRLAFEREEEDSDDEGAQAADAPRARTPMSEDEREPPVATGEGLDRVPLVTARAREMVQEASALLAPTPARGRQWPQTGTDGLPQDATMLAPTDSKTLQAMPDFSKLSLAEEILTEFKEITNEDLEMLINGETRDDLASLKAHAATSGPDALEDVTMPKLSFLMHLLNQQSGASTPENFTHLKCCMLDAIRTKCRTPRPKTTERPCGLGTGCFSAVNYSKMGLTAPLIGVEFYTPHDEFEFAHQGRVRPCAPNLCVLCQLSQQLRMWVATYAVESMHPNEPKELPCINFWCCPDIAPQCSINGTETMYCGMMGPVPRLTYMNWSEHRDADGTRVMHNNWWKTIKESEAQQSSQTAKDSPFQ